MLRGAPTFGLSELNVLSNVPTLLEALIFLTIS